MHVVGRGDHHRVDVLAFLQQHAVVFEDLRLGIRLEGVGGVFPVHVAQGHDVFAGHLPQVARSLPAHADAGDVEFLVGRRLAASAQHVPRHDGNGRRGQRRAAQKGASGCLSAGLGGKICRCSHQKYPRIGRMRTRGWKVPSSLYPSVTKPILAVGARVVNCRVHEWGGQDLCSIPVSH